MINKDDFIVPIMKDIQNIVGGKIIKVGDIKYLLMPNRTCVEIRQRSNLFHHDDNGIWSIWLWLKYDGKPSFIVPLNNPNAIKIIAEEITRYKVKYK